MSIYSCNLYGGSSPTVSLKSGIETWDDKNVFHFDNKKILETLDNNDPSEDLIEELSKDADLKECFALDAGVWERYSIGEHSNMVLNKEAKYFPSAYNTFPKGITRGEFRLFLALHDIGKGYAVKERRYDRKEWELKYNRLIMKKVMKELNIHDDKIKIFEAMHSYDTLGSYLQGFRTVETAVDQINDMAKKAEMNPFELLDFFEIFFTVDAGSYPGLFRGIFQVVDGQMKHGPRNQKYIDSLRKKLESSII